MADKPQILQTMEMPLRIAERLGDRYEVHHLWQATDRDAFLADNGPSVTGMVTLGHGKVDPNLIDSLPNLEVISVLGVGYDGIDVKHAASRGAAVTNTPDVLTDEVANLGVGLVLALTREIPKADAYVREGRWLKGDMAFNRTIVNRPVGVVGLGRIGLATADRLKALGAIVSWHGPHQKADVPYPYDPDLAHLASKVDGLVLCCPGGPATRHIVNRKVIDALGPEGWLVNVARGSVVDEQALVEALMTRRIWGAGLDVFEAEPKVPRELFELDNVVLQPHQASATTDTRYAMADLVVENLDLHFAGEPLKTPVYS
jgi:lactate dehydrogenase-like 2-hydroxyacid dehydrogenase